MIRAVFAAALALPVVLAQSDVAAPTQLEELAELLWQEEGALDSSELRALTANSDVNGTTKPPTTPKPTTPPPTTTKARPAVGQKIMGTMKMTVSNPAAFVADPKAKTAIGKSIAKLVSCPVEWVIVALSVGRRLSDDDARRLSGSVKVDYTIEIPLEIPAGTTFTGSATSIESALKATPTSKFSSEIGAALVAEGASITSVSVTEAAPPTVTIVATTKPPTTTAPPGGASSATVRTTTGFVATLLFVLAGGKQLL